MKIILALLFGLFLFIGKTQVSKRPFNGIHFNVLLKPGAAFSLGGFYSRNFPRKTQMLEWKIGCGVEGSFFGNTGMAIRLWNRKENLKLYFETDFVYIMKGIEIRDQGHNNDVYNISSRQYLNSMLLIRYFFNDMTAFQFRVGYSLLAKSVNIEHIEGPNTHYNILRKSVSSSLFFGLGVAVFFNTYADKLKQAELTK